MPEVESKTGLKTAIRLFQYVPLTVFILSILFILQFRLINLDDSMVEKFRILYDAFAEHAFIEVIIPLMIHAGVFLLYDWRHNRKISHAFRYWGRHRGIIKNTDSSLLRQKRWKSLLKTTIRRTGLLSVLFCLPLIPVVLILKLVALGSNLTEAKFFGVMIFIGPAVFMGFVAIAVYFFKKRSNWHILFRGICDLVNESEATLIGETFQNSGFLHWLDVYWSGDWKHGYAWHGIGAAMIISQFPVFVYGDQRSSRKLHILIAARIPDSFEESEELKELRGNLKKDGFTIETGNAGAVVSVSKTKVSTLLMGAELHGEEACLGEKKRMIEILNVLSLMGARPE